MAGRRRKAQPTSPVQPVYTGYLHGKLLSPHAKSTSFKKSKPIESLIWFNVKITYIHVFV
jgi:hypothetical protein